MQPSQTSRFRPALLATPLGKVSPFRPPSPDAPHRPSAPAALPPGWPAARSLLNCCLLRWALVQNHLTRWKYAFQQTEAWRKMAKMMQIEPVIMYLTALPQSPDTGTGSQYHALAGQARLIPRRPELCHACWPQQSTMHSTQAVARCTQAAAASEQAHLQQCQLGTLLLCNLLLTCNLCLHGCNGFLRLPDGSLALQVLSLQVTSSHVGMAQCSGS